MTEYRQLARQAILEDPRFADFAEEIAARKAEMTQLRMPAGADAPALR